MGRCLILGKPGATGTAVEGEIQGGGQGSHLLVLKTLLLLLSPPHPSSHLPPDSKPERKQPALNQVYISPVNAIKLFQ